MLKIDYLKYNSGYSIHNSANLTRALRHLSETNYSNYFKIGQSNLLTDYNQYFNFDAVQLIDS